MIIWLEGPDGSGKSTLKDSIYDTLTEGKYNTNKVDANGELLIPTHPARDGRLNEQQLFKQLKKMVLSDCVYIVDRGPRSDCIYRVFDNYKPVTTLNKVINFIKHYNNKIFLCYCRTDVAEEKMLERGDENPVALTRHKELTRLYDMVMGLISVNCPYNFRKYDFTKKRSINELLGQISYFVYMNGGLN